MGKVVLQPGDHSGSTCKNGGVQSDLVVLLLEIGLIDADTISPEILVSSLSSKSSESLIQAAGYHGTRAIQKYFIIQVRGAPNIGYCFVFKGACGKFVVDFASHQTAFQVAMHPNGRLKNEHPNLIWIRVMIRRRMDESNSYLVHTRPEFGAPWLILLCFKSRPSCKNVSPLAQEEK